MMFESLKTYCKSKVPLSEEELQLINTHFEQRAIHKKELFLEQGKICHFIGFISIGTVRHFHLKNGAEKTCAISFENSWVTDFLSFTNSTPCQMNLQALEPTDIFTITKENLNKLYETCFKYETFGRLMAEQVAHNATAIAMSLSADKPEERFQNLLKNQPDLFQRVSQKYIANLLGISAESLSRIRNRVLNQSKS